ncbi:ATP-binding cassette domain-containing protein [bacterium]|nr:ATP-binding cassette domain-containing protein [bacterium]
MLELKAISKRLGGLPILQEVHLSVSPDEIVFVLGRSGVGKSVLLKTIVGLIPQDQGKVFLNGQPMDCFDESALTNFRRKVSLVFQMPALLDSLTVEENLLFALRKPFPEREELQNWLSELQLDVKCLDRMPQELSLGVQKKISVLRSVLLKPQFLLFDEPTTGLDPVGTRMMNDLIVKSVRKTHSGCLIVSHDVQSALEIAHKIILLDQGRVVFEGKPFELKQCQLLLAQAFVQGIVSQ